MRKLAPKPKNRIFGAEKERVSIIVFASESFNNLGFI